VTQAGQDLRSMPEARVREWFEGLPKEELVEMLVSHVLVYERDRPEEEAEGGLGAMSELRQLTFAQLIDRLKALTSHPEMSRLRVDGERVVYVTGAGAEIPLNATGERDSGPRPLAQAGPVSPPSPPSERPPDAHVIDPARPRASGGGGPLFGGAGRPERRLGGGEGPTARRPEPATQGEASASPSKESKVGAKKGSLLEF